MLTLSGASTYTGSTLINVGTFTLDGSLVSNAVTVANGATANITNGGLAADTALTANGTVNLTHDEQIEKLLGGGLVKITGSTFTVNQGTFSGVLSGDGNLTKSSSGLLTLSGANDYTGSTNVQAGTLTLTGSLVSNAVSVANGATANITNAGLASDTTLTANGTVNFSGSEQINKLLGAGTVDLAGSILTVNSGSFSGATTGNGGITKASAGTLILSGNNTSTGTTQINAGTVTLSGSLASLQVNVASGASLNVTNGGLSGSAAFSNNGTTTLSIDDTVASYTNSGTLNGPGKLNAASYTLNNGSIINTKLGAGNLTTNGLVILSDTSDSLHVTVNTGSTLTLNGAQLLNSGASAFIDGTLNLSGGDQTIHDLNGNGTINVNAFKFIVTSGNSSNTFTGSINAGTTKIISDGGILNLNGGTTNTKTTEVTNGGTLNIENGGKLNTNDLTIANGSLLFVDGASKVAANVITVNGTLKVPDSSTLGYNLLQGYGLIDSQGGTFTNQSGSSVKGFLTFNGNFTNNGIFAPGNSPGLTTILGNYTEAGTLQSELETTTPITGHDQVRVGGAVALTGTSTLVIQTYKSKMPARGSNYQIIASLTGGNKAVTGSFDSVLFDADGLAGPNAAVSNAAVVFDQATGRVISTGLNKANSTFADLGKSGNQRRAATALLTAATDAVGTNQINTSTSTGALAEQIISANGGSDTNLARFTPEFYGAIADYALASQLQINNLLHSRVSTMTGLPGQSGDGVSLFSGLLQHSADNADGADINRTDIYAGGDYAISKNLSIGLVATHNNGDFSSTYGQGDVDGLAADAYLIAKVNPSFDAYGRLGYGSNSYDLTRTTTDIVKANGNTDSDVFSGSVGVTYTGWKWGEVSFAPTADLTYSRASVDGFTESGANDRLSLGSYDSTNLIAQVGTLIVWSTKLDGHQFSAELSLGIEQRLINDKGDQSATMVNAPAASFTQTFEDGNSTSAAIGLNLGYGITDSTTIYGGYDGSFSSNSSGNFNAGVRVSF